MQMPALRSSVLVATAAGLIAATPIVLIFLSDPEWMGSTWGRIVVVPAVAVCPSWWLFWSVLAAPDDLQFALKLCGLALVFNALLFAPVGVLHASMLGLSSGLRRTLVAVGLALMLALGHLFFMAEPAPVAALLGWLAA